MARRFEPRATTPRVRLSEVYITQERYEEALEHLDVLVRWEASNPNYNLHPGLAQLRLKQWEKARHSLEISVGLGGKPEGCAFLMEAYKELGELEKDIEAGQRYLSITEDPQEIEGVRAVLQRLEKRLENER